MKIRALATVLALGLTAACSSPGGAGGPYYLPTDGVGTDQAGGGDQAGATDLGPGVDPGALPDLGPGVDPGPLPDPGPTPDPGVTPDPGATPDPGPQDTGPQVTTIPQIQSNSNAQGCDGAVIATLGLVNVTGVVVTSPKYDAYTPSDGSPGLDGYYVSDPAGGPWSGIDLVVDRAKGYDFAPGQILSITGEAQEYYCETQIEALAVAVTGSTAAPAPLNLAPASIAQEQYEGMLLSVKGVEVTESVEGGVYRVTGGFLVDHQFDFFLTLAPGATYDIVGQLAWEYGEYRLMPRTGADVVLVGGGTSATTAELQQSTASASCVVEALTPISSGHIIEGVVSAGPWDVSTSLRGFGLYQSSDPGGAIMLAASLDLGGADLLPGDHIIATGDHFEAWCNTQLTATSPIQILGTVAPPAPVFLGSFPSGDVEPWEGAVVTLSAVSVTGDPNWLSYGELETDAGVLIDSELAGSLTSPGVGTTLTSVTGFVRYSFGAYRVSPRSAADLVY